MAILNLFKKLFGKKKTSSNENLNKLVNSIAIVIEDIDADDYGKVRLGGSWWIASSNSKNGTIKVGEKVIVRDVNGFKLIVERC